MKKNYRFCCYIIAVTAFIMMTFGVQAQRSELRFDTQYEKEGFNIQRSDLSSFRFTHSVPKMAIDYFETDGYAGQTIEMNGIYLPGEAGAPNLPANSRFIAIPKGATASLKIISAKTEKFQNIDLLPAPPIPLDTDDKPLVYNKNEAIYSKDGFYPANPFQLSAPTTMRGVDVVMAGITPFQYNPVTKELIVYYDVEAEIVFEGGNGTFGEDRLRSRWWDPMMNDNILNSNVLPEIDYSKRLQEFNKSKEEGCEYLIIIPNNAVFAQWADTIRVFRQHQGIITKVVTIAEVGGNTVNAIETYVNNAYNNWTMVPAAILLLADYSTDASAGIVSHLLNDHPGGYNPYISDNPFSDVTGDLLPEFVFARITAQNAAQLELMINKFLNYERTPPTSFNFYNNPVTAMGYQTERWFQLCSETVNGFWEFGLGKNPVRQNAIYQGTPGGAWSSNANTAQVVNYFGPNGLNYIPANTAHLTDWGGNATRINNSINSGAFMVQHRDHGMETGWGEPSYTNTSLNGLTNQDLTFVFSVNCLTGKFNYGSECFTEKFHRHNQGALGLVAATEVSYSFVNDVYVWGAYDNMWPQFMPAYGTTPAERGILPAFGNVAGKYFLQQSNWPYNPQHKNITYNLFHHHGDAFMTVYSEVPQQLVVNHMPVLISGMDAFEVTANEGALIALTVDNEIIGVGTGTGAPVQIPILTIEPGVNILVTVTLQNYYRYEQTIGCIPPSGPYMIYNEAIISDITGNNNGAIDYGENIKLDIALKNVGSEAAANVNVVAATTSEYVTMVSSSFAVGNVAPGTIVNTPLALEFNVNNTIPNNTAIPFTLTITSGTNEWTSTFVLPAYAPEFSVGSITISDPTGNGNGRLDPGETVEITFTATNTGESAALNAIGNFLNTNPHITVTNQTQNFAQIPAGQELNVTYTAEVSGAAPVGSVAAIGFKIAAGVYEAQKMFNAKIGLILEDFESGNFDQYAWVNGGNQPWQITNIEPFEGIYAAKSGTITHNQSSQLSVQYEVGAADTISFFFKVSSEATYDFFRFYINNVKVGEWSGEVAWTKASFPVSIGIQTFKWEYMKDGSVSSGSDAARIDEIAFPPMAVTTAWAGVDMQICADMTAQLNAAATNCISMNWTSSGTGTFSDATIMNPIYTPSLADIDAGNVQLTFTATGTSVVSDHLVLTFNPAPTAVAGDDTSICPTEVFLIAGSSATNYSTISWITSGDGNFDDASALHPVYTPGLMDIESGNVNLGLTVNGLSGCNTVNDIVALTIYPVVAVELIDAAEICSGYNTLDITEVSATNYASSLWSTDGDGIFGDVNSLQTSYTPGTNDELNGSVVLKLTVQSEGECSILIDSLTLQIHPLPVVNLGIDQTICAGQSTNIELTLTGQAPWTLSMASPETLISIEASPYTMLVTPETSMQYIAASISDMYCNTNTDASVWVNVNTIPAQPLALSGADTVDFNNGYQTVYTLTAVESASTYTVSIEPTTAGSITLNNLEASVNWNTEFRGDATFKVMAANDCGESSWSESKIVNVKSTIGLNELNASDVSIYPNPTNGTFTLELKGQYSSDITLNISDVVGKTIYNEIVKDAKTGINKQLSLIGFENGIYILTIESNNQRLIKKLILQ